jgi:hypothetical protein
MARGLLFCREAAADLGWSGYLTDVLSVLGADSISSDSVVELQDIAVRVVGAARFTETEKAIRRRFLRSADWLLENAQPADAVWPLYFWTSTTVEESDGRRDPYLWEQWREFAAILGIAEEQHLLEKKERAQRLLDLAVELVEAYKPRLSL